MSNSPYGLGSSTYDAAGGIEGIRHLVDDFYNIMDQSTSYETIRKMHPKDLVISKDKLSCFLSAWMGGDMLYMEKYGPINIPQYHSHIKIGFAERDMWMNCMIEALHKQGYSESLISYLTAQLAIPAERIRLASEEAHQ